MCINPSFVWVQLGPKWEKQQVPCKKCWRCKKNRVDGYVGRALAEAAMSQRVCTITLTYAPRDDLADRLLHPSHFQLFMKQLRNAGHRVRYLVAGEYGDLKGRTHFHAILFFQNLLPLAEQKFKGVARFVPRYKDDYPGAIRDSPEEWGSFCDQIPQMRMVHIREWPHGHVKVDWASDERSIRYVCKYILADDKNRAWFSLSKKPALGAAWFAQKAEQAKALGVLPSTFNYLPPGASRERPYYMTGATRRDYLNAISQNPDDKPKMSEWTRNVFEKHERERLMHDLENQPLDIQEQAFNDRRERETEQFDQKREWERLRYVDGLAEKLAQSKSGVLRRVDGELKEPDNG